MNIVDWDSKYDIIIGHDVLATLGLILDFKDKTITWDEAVAGMPLQGPLSETHQTKFVKSNYNFNLNIQQAIPEHLTV